MVSPPVWMMADTNWSLKEPSIEANLFFQGQVIALKEQKIILAINGVTGMVDHRYIHCDALPRILVLILCTEVMSQLL